MKQKKRYFFSVTEEFIMNPEYQGYRGGRIEVHDRESENPYADYEARFTIPEEFYDAFREVFDWQESDLMPMIVWNYEKETDTDK